MSCPLTPGRMAKLLSRKIGDTIHSATRAKHRRLPRSWDRLATLGPSGKFPCDFETRASDARDLGVASGNGHSLSKYCVTNARVIASPRPDSRRMSSADIAEKSVG